MKVVYITSPVSITKWRALFVCIEPQTAIYAVIVTKHIISQYFEPVVQCELLLNLKFEDFAVFFAEIFLSQM